MNQTVFRTESRIDRPLMRIIHAAADNPGRKLTIYLDRETKKPIYPVTIEPVIPGIIVTIQLDSDNKASCSFPPSIPDTMINGFIEYLKLFHDTVLAVRELIKEEQKIM